MSEIDRISPSSRPPSWVAGYHVWSDLTFIHWQVPVALLEPLLPNDLTIDTYNGTAWLGLVPFQMFGVRPWWSPSLRGISNFPETNVRTYVHFRDRDPGVWFFSLDAAKWLAVTLARWGWGLNYHWARMSVQTNGSRVAYRSSRIATSVDCNVDIEVDAPLPNGAVLGQTRVARPGSLEHFLVERYYLYATRFGNLYRGQVHHRPYPLHSAHLLNLDQGLVRANQIAIDREPCHVLFSPGVSVEVFGLHKIARLGSQSALATATAPGY